MMAIFWCTANPGGINVTGDMRVDNVGHIRIKADQGNIVFDANVTTASDSSISIQSLQNIHQLANSTISTTAGGTIDLWSEGASILQQDSAIITTGETGSVRLLAGDSIALAAVHVGTGNVSLMTEAGSIVDSGDSHKDIVARELRVDASVGMGAGNAIDTSVDVYAGRAGSGGLHIDEDSDITVSTLDDISIQRVKSDGSTETVTDNAISDLRTSDNGSISLKTIDGTITVYDGNVPDDGVGIYAHGSGSVHLDAYGSGQDVRIKEDTDVVSDQGNIHILAEDAVLQEAGADIAVGTGGNIAVWALNGSIYMTDGTMASTKGAGNILYHAKVDVDLSRLSGEAHTTVIADSGQIRDNLEIGADRINYDAKIDPDSSRVVDSLHTTVIRNGAEYFGDFKIGLLFGETANISSSSLSMIANQGIGVLGVQDIDTDVEQIEMVNKSRNHVFVQEADSVNVFGQGLRNFNDNGDLMFSTIVDELYIDGKNIRERFPDYSTDGQKVDGYTIDGYTLQDFYLDEGIRIVNGKVHTGKEGYLYVRSSVGDWGPMNYDQLADELSRISNDEVIVANQRLDSFSQSSEGSEGSGSSSFGDVFNSESDQGAMQEHRFDAQTSDPYSPTADELKTMDFQSLVGLLNDQASSPDQQNAPEVVIEYEAETSETEVDDENSQPVEVEYELLSEDEPLEQRAEDNGVSAFLSIVNRLYGDQTLDEQTLYSIYCKDGD